MQLPLHIFTQPFFSTSSNNQQPNTLRSAGPRSFVGFTNVDQRHPKWITHVQPTGLARNPPKTSSPPECLCSTLGVQGLPLRLIEILMGKGHGLVETNTRILMVDIGRLIGKTCLMVPLYSWVAAWSNSERTCSSYFGLVEFTFWWCKTRLER